MQIEHVVMQLTFVDTMQTVFVYAIIIPSSNPKCSPNSPVFTRPRPLKKYVPHGIQFLISGRNVENQCDELLLYNIPPEKSHREFPSLNVLLCRPCSNLLSGCGPLRSMSSLCLSCRHSHRETFKATTIVDHHYAV